MLDVPRTHGRELADVLMGGTLDAYVAEQRLVGVSWRAIARGIALRTGSKVNVTGEAVRQWYAGEELPEVASA